MVRRAAWWWVVGFVACGNGSTSGSVTAPQQTDSGAADARGEAAAAAMPLDCSVDDPDWPMYGHDPCNTHAPSNAGGITPQNASKLAVKWTFSAAGDVTATPAVVAGQVYVPDWGGMMNRIDAATGKAVWSKPVAELAGLAPDGAAPPDPVVSRVTPTLAGHALVFGLSRTGFSSAQSLAYVVAVDPDTAAPLWSTVVDDHRAAIITGSPVVEGGRVYVGVASLEEAVVALSSGYPCCTFRGSVVALDAATGKVVWKTPMIEDAVYFAADGKTPAGYAGAAVWSGTPTVDRKRRSLVVTTGNNYAMPAGVTAAPPGDHVESIVALDLDTGAIKWSHAMTTDDVWTFANQAGPDFDFGCGANLFQANVDGGVRDLVGAGQKSGIYWALDADTGAVVWKTQVGPGGHLGGIHWGTAVDGSHVYTGVNDESGAAYTLGGAGSQAGTKATVGSWAALDPAAGAIAWQVANPSMTAPLSGASVNGPVAVAGGVVFGGSMDAKGTMFALDATSGAVLWSFPSGGTVYSGPAVAGGVVYWGCGYPAGPL
jgi:polyvinyl alcohol dehydrogenase (cytochrome)